MDTHYGDIVERTIRRNGYSISELARVLKVNRRSIYNWFNQRNLKPEIIYRIGHALRHDFSEEFPHLFTKEDFKPANRVTGIVLEKVHLPENEPSGIQNSSHWKNKYIHLLEEYNNMLLSQVRQKDPALIHELHI